MNNDIITVQGNKEFKLKKIEYARWLCLLEAIDIIERKAESLKLDTAGDDFWVKPLAFQKYIDNRLETMILDIDREEFNLSVRESLQINKETLQTLSKENINEEVEEDVEEAVPEEMLV